MRLVCDCHIHSTASGHAYSTINENTLAAAAKGLELIATTDHAPQMPGGAHLFHFFNLKVLPKTLHGVRLLRGSEVNILDLNGVLDMDDKVLSLLDVVIASLHQPCFRSGTKTENTQAVIRVMQSPYVHIIGHPDDSRIPLDYESLVRAAADTGTMLEINNSSLMPIAFRENAEENYETMINLSLKLGARMIVNSDAHFYEDVGNFTKVLPLLERLNVPEVLIANTSAEKLLSWLDEKKKHVL